MHHHHQNSSSTQRFQTPFSQPYSSSNSSNAHNVQQLPAFIGTDRNNAASLWDFQRDAASAQTNGASSSSLAAATSMATVESSTLNEDKEAHRPAFMSSKRKRKRNGLATSTTAIDGHQSPGGGAISAHDQQPVVRAFTQASNHKNSFASLYSAPHGAMHSDMSSTPMENFPPQRGKLKRPPIGDAAKMHTHRWMEQLRKRIKKTVNPRKLTHNFSRKLAKVDTLLPFTTSLPDVVTLLLCFGVLQWNGFGGNYQEIAGCPNVLFVGLIILLQGYLSSLSILITVVAPLICFTVNPNWNHRLFRAALFFLISIFVVLRLPLVILLQVWLSTTHCGPNVSYFWLALIACISMWINLFWGMGCWTLGCGIRIFDVAKVARKLSSRER
mmetsp:Transcript_761/g.2542  ORF Transcript_761/g.2542 Transcript_761/m.2542 type:complete len:385 (-) Transcript_761:166-1320(-)|eukprot:CAMPEP_0117437128 /NCGR_PEP_ID=MMETSP0759-20121206/1362_1 /TAXON_ID=63605 /ORGANISM="Percolomonas cosmopolitus, Strain WS" /LENGTH=384 /DNA_ID=CAMNT_0005228747 /DNA_START=108 /DNA_END=1262 /DNA_ORIENTATION=+